MKAMIFGDYPEWKAIIAGLGVLEERINRVDDSRRIA